MAERLIQNTALKWWRPGDAGDWIANVMVTLKRYESRETYIYESPLCSREILLDEDYLEEKTLEFLIQICIILNVTVSRVQSVSQ